MAIYHVHAKVLNRSAGHSAVAAASYRSASKLEDLTYGVVRDYQRKESVVDTGILAPSNAPDWVKDREILWNAVEVSEKRKDAQIAREVEFSLPTDMEFDDQRKLARQYITENFVRRGMVADYAIHANEGNPHCHVMLTTREIGPDGFGKKERSWNDRDMLKDWRAKWAELANRAMMKLGIDQRIDHRTLRAQGIDREPTKHRGTGINNEYNRVMAEIAKLGCRVDEHGQIVEIKPKLGSVLDGLDAIQKELDKHGGTSRAIGTGSDQAVGDAAASLGNGGKDGFGRGGEQYVASVLGEHERRIREAIGEAEPEPSPTPGSNQQADRGNKLDRGKSQDQQPANDRDGQKRNQEHDAKPNGPDRTKPKDRGISR